MNSIEQLMFDWRTQSSKHQCPAGFLVKSPTWSFLPPPTSHIHFSPPIWPIPPSWCTFSDPLYFACREIFFTFKIYTKIIGTYCYISSGYWSPLVQKSGSLPHFPGVPCNQTAKVGLISIEFDWWLTFHWARYWKFTVNFDWCWIMVDFDISIGNFRLTLFHWNCP